MGFLPLALCLVFSGVCQAIVLPPSTCPKLPSGKCWVDCSFKVHQIICEEVDYASLHNDVRLYEETVKRLSPTEDVQVSLAIWNSPDLLAIETNLLHHLERHLLALTLQNLKSLQFFPMLRDFRNLTELHINNCPNVTELDLTILPHNLVRLSILQTGINRLENRIEHPFQLPFLEDFTFQQNDVIYMQGKFLHSFPVLKTIFMSDNKFNLTIVNQDTFATLIPLLQLYFSNNDFSGTSETFQRQIFKDLVDSLKLDPGFSLADLSGNRLPIYPETAANLKNLKNARLLQLRGNNFVGSVSTSGIFSAFSQLTSLDVSDTMIKASPGLFSGLTSLSTLRADGNMFHDLTVTDIFTNIGTTTLTTLSLARNGLAKLPGNSFSQVKAKIADLDLSGNLLNDLDEFKGTTTPTTFIGFTNLKRLNLRNNRFPKFPSVLVQPLVNLQELDVSCNEFTEITTASFSSIPPSLVKLNMDFCPSVPYTDGNAPKISSDAFTALRNVTVLSISNGFQRDLIFDKLDRLPNPAQLATLTLNNNGIRTLIPSLVKKLTLKGLHLRNNQIQILLPHNGRFSDGNWAALETLDLSDNQISSLERHHLGGLENLKNLYLENNQMTRISPGVFNQIPNLVNLYMRDNFIKSVHHFWNKTGEKLQGFNFERNQIKTVTVADTLHLKHLHQFYLHQCPVEIIESGAMDGFDYEKIAIALPKDTLTCDCRNNWLRDYINSKKFSNFFYFIVEDPGDPNIHLSLSHVPKCRHVNGNTYFVTEPFECSPALAVDPNSAEDSGMSSGTIAGIVIGVLLGVALLGGVAYMVLTGKTSEVADRVRSTAASVRGGVSKSGQSSRSHEAVNPGYSTD